MKISCVIVTFNRPVLLKKVVEAVLAQSFAVDDIIVVDNHSNEETTALLSELASDFNSITHLRLNNNTGGAGGFYNGIKAAYSKGADWIWVFDDDAIPEKDALEKLVSSNIFNFYLHGVQGRQLGFLASRVEWTDGTLCYMNIPRVHRDWPELQDMIPESVRLFSCSFVSALINREAVKRFGYPVKEFFIWYDDTEYTSRISEDMPGYFVPESRVVHYTNKNIRPLDPEHLDSNSLWKYQFGIRNETAVLAREGGVSGYLRATLFVASKSYLMLVNRVKLNLVFRFTLAGIRGLFFNYRKYIEFPET